MVETGMFYVELWPQEVSTVLIYEVTIAARDTATNNNRQSSGDPGTFDHGRTPFYTAATI